MEKTEVVSDSFKISMALELHQIVKEKEMKKLIYSKLFSKFKSLINNKITLQNEIKVAEN
jgi:hypothetical protein